MTIISKPILYQQSAFDATKDHEFRYSYNGNQQFKVEMIIRNNETNAIVYQNTQTTFLLKYVLLADSILNGVTYNAQIIVYDSNNNPSPPSDKILFVCFLTPEFYFSNLVNNQIIGDSILNIDIHYYQINDEPLDYYIINLMDSSGNILHSSGNLYPLIDGMSYAITSLIDNMPYKIQSIGKTLNGMNIETEIINFSVEYIVPPSLISIRLENIPTEASIKIASNLFIIEGYSNPSPPIFINNEMVDLTDPAHWVKFDEGFNIERDFAIEIKCRQLARNTTFFKLSDKSNDNQITLQKWQGEFHEMEQNYIVLYATYKTLTYRITSNLIPLLADSEMITIQIRRQNNIFSIAVEREV